MVPRDSKGRDLSRTLPAEPSSLLVTVPRRAPRPPHGEVSTTRQDPPPATSNDASNPYRGGPGEARDRERPLNKSVFDGAERESPKPRGQRT